MGYAGVTSNDMARMLVAAGWIVVVAAGVLLTSQIVGWSGNAYLVAMQALTPFVVVLASASAVVGILDRAWILAVCAGAAVGGHVVLAWPLLVPPRQPPALDGATPVRVFHANLLYLNPRPGGIPDAIAAAGADVLAFTEYTPDHASILLHHGLADVYPFRTEHAQPGAGGSAIWSRYRLSELEPPDLHFRPCSAVIASPEPVVVMVVHPLSPMVSIDVWHSDLRALAARPTTTEHPVAVVGDFNASHWHPPFRRLLGAGWRDAHQSTRRGWSNSWPAGRRWLPPFVGIDHALIDGGLVTTEIRDLEVPGSDHRGFLVTIIAARH